MSDITERAKEIIEGNIYVTVATSSNDQPWNTPTYAVHDNDYNFYWVSWINAQHSKNIRKNENAFIVIYDTTREYGTNHRRCVYIQAKVQELNEAKEIEEALANFHFPNRDNPPVEDLSGESVKRMYKAVPQKMWLNDKAESKMTKDDVKMRVEVHLSDLG